MAVRAETDCTAAIRMMSSMAMPVMIISMVIMVMTTFMVAPATITCVVAMVMTIIITEYHRATIPSTIMIEPQDGRIACCWMTVFPLMMSS